MEVKLDKDEWQVKIGDVVELEDGKYYLVIDDYCGYSNWKLLDLSNLKIGNIIPNSQPLFFSPHEKNIVNIVHVYEANVTLVNRKS